MNFIEYGSLRKNYMHGCNVHKTHPVNYEIQSPLIINRGSAH